MWEKLRDSLYSVLEAAHFCHGHKGLIDNVRVAGTVNQFADGVLHQIDEEERELRRMRAAIEQWRRECDI